MSDTPTHETPEQVIGELFAVAKLKEDGYRAEITPSDIRSWAQRFKEALFRDRDAARTESTDNEKFLACTVLSLVRAHYDRDEARFHEVSEGLAKFFDQTGRGDLASFVRAQTGDEPSWVPMDAAPTSSAPTAEPPVKSIEDLVKDADYAIASFWLLLLAKKIARLLLRHAEGGEYSDSYDVYAEARELLAEDDSAS